MFPTSSNPAQRIVTPVVIERYSDVEKAVAGAIPSEAIRRVEVVEAVVDESMTGISLTPSLIEALGLRPCHPYWGRVEGPRGPMIYDPVQVTIQERSDLVSVSEIPEGTPVLIGEHTLMVLDLVRFPEEGRIGPNPAHGGEWMIEMY